MASRITSSLHSCSISVATRCCAARLLAACLLLLTYSISFYVASAHAGDTNPNNTAGTAGGTTTLASKVLSSDNGNLIFAGPTSRQDDSTTWGVQVRAGAASVPISAWGVIRYIDNPTTKGDMLAPFGSLAEWSAFIANAGTSGLYVDLARPKHTLAYGSVAGKVDFVSGLSSITNLVAGNDTHVAVADTSVVRIDTRSAAALTAFSNAKEDRVQSFPMSRKDCLGNITYPDGSVRNPCTTWNWTEAVTATFTYNLGGNNSVAKLRPLAVSAGTASDVGTWNTPTFSGICPIISATTTGGGATATASPTCPPAVAAPKMQTCPPGVAHNTDHWVDMGTNVELAACPAGYISDPTNPYSLSYTLQQTYLCFDSTDYPKTATRHKPGSDINFGTCLPIINGACGTANNKQLASAPSGAALCNAGDATIVAGNNPFTWSCVGKNTGTTATCKTANCGSDKPFTGGACSLVGLSGSGTVSGTYTSDMCTPTYTGTWTATGSGCSATCGGGTSSVSYVCTGGNGQCNPFFKPADYSQSCNTQACYTGTWYASGGGCSQTCGGGSETVSYYCSNGNCDPGSKPGSYTQQCNTQACPPVCNDVSGWTGWAPWWQGPGTGCQERQQHTETWCNGVKTNDVITFHEYSCNCPSGQEWNGSNCQVVPQSCPGNQEWLGTTCGCANGTTWNGSSCVVASCSYYTAWTPWAGWGGCPGGQVRDEHNASNCSGVVTDLGGNGNSEYYCPPQAPARTEVCYDVPGDADGWAWTGSFCDNIDLGGICGGWGGTSCSTGIVSSTMSQCRWSTHYCYLQ